MTRRKLLGSALVYSASSLVSAQPSITLPPGFPGTKFYPYSRCLPDYLSLLNEEAVRRRSIELDKLISPAAIRSRQKQVAATLWELIGGRSEKTPLNVRNTGVLKRAGYRVEKVIYESQPKVFISANLYIPESREGKLPAVLFQSGHYWEAKAYPSYQRCCQGLAQLGFVVLAFDPMGQGERIHYLDVSGNRSRLSSCDAEHTMPGKQMLLCGDSSARFQLWDAIRSLDYLLSLPFVDPSRVASVGHSGGGTLTMLLAAADQRLAAAAVCMGNIENASALPFHPPGAMDDAEQDFPFSGPAGFDRWDLFYPFAPKPMLIWPSDRDFYATYSSNYVANGWQEYQRLKSVYGKLDRSNCLGWADTPLPHALAYDSRLLIYNWFSKWLTEDSRTISEEPVVKPEEVSSLWATETGSVVRSLSSTTPFAINNAKKAQRNKLPLQKLLGVTSPKTTLRAETIGRVKSRNVNVEVLEVQSEPAVKLPVFLLIPDKIDKTTPVLLVLDETSNDRLWFAPEVDRILPPDSPVICAADVRGVGALIPEFSRGAAEYAAWHQQEENYAWGSLIVGKPLVGQRVTDILALKNALHNHPATAGRPIYMAASGKLTVPALFAAALESGIQGLYLSNGLASFQNIVETEVYDHPFANFVPNLLLHTDLPEIAASIGPCHVVIAGPVNAMSQSMELQQARDIYATAISGGHLTILAQESWSAETLISYVKSQRS